MQNIRVTRAIKRNIPVSNGWVGRKWVQGSWKHRLNLAANLFGKQQVWPANADQRVIQACVAGRQARVQAI